MPNQTPEEKDEQIIREGLDRLYPPKKKYNYERNGSHVHCWNQGKSPACGQSLESHTQCCLCDTPAPKKCNCACHENKLKKLYEHDTKCCDQMNGNITSSRADYSGDYEDPNFPPQKNTWEKVIHEVIDEVASWSIDDCWEQRTPLEKRRIIEPILYLRSEAIQEREEKHFKRVNKILNMHSKTTEEGGLDYVKAFEEMENYENELLRLLSNNPTEKEK